LSEATRRPRRSGGSVAIEYALLLPVLLLFVLGIIDTGRLLWSYATLQRAVDAAARCGAVGAASCATTAQIASYAAGQAFGLAVTPAAFSVSTPACGVNVRGTLRFSFIIPWLGASKPFGSANAITIGATGCYPT
jgi:Flp pilus assembly protein TadG